MPNIAADPIAYEIANCLGNSKMWQHGSKILQLFICFVWGFLLFIIAHDSQRQQDFLYKRPFPVIYACEIPNEKNLEAKVLLLEHNGAKWLKPAIDSANQLRCQHQTVFRQMYAVSIDGQCPRE